MPEEEMTEVEETEVEEKTVEETKVEETKVETKTDEKAKEGDAKEETKLGDGDSGSGDSEVSYEVRKAMETIPPELPPGAVFTFNVHHIDSQSGQEDDFVKGCVGLFDGAVLDFRIAEGAIQYGNVMEYSAFIASIFNPTGTDKVLELSGCGRSLPSKESTRFTMNLVLEGGGK